MQTTFANELGWLRATPALTATLARGEAYAGAQQHRFVMLEHVLLALTEDEDAAALLMEARIDMGRLRDDVAAFLGRLNDRIHPGEGSRPQVHPDLRRILEYAAQAAQRSRRPQINGAVVVAAVVGEGRSVAANILKSHGLTFQDAIRALQRQPPVQEQGPPPAPPPPNPAPMGSRAEARFAPPPPQGATSGGLQPLSASPLPRPSVGPLAAPPAPPMPPEPPSIGGLPAPHPLPEASAPPPPAEMPWVARAPAPPPEEHAAPAPAPVAAPSATDIAREAILAQARERVQASRGAAGTMQRQPVAPEPVPVDAADIEAAAPVGVAPPEPPVPSAIAPVDSYAEAMAPPPAVPAEPGPQEPNGAAVSGYDAPSPEDIMASIGGEGAGPGSHAPAGPPPPAEAAAPVLPEQGPHTAMPPPVPPRVHPHHPLPIQHAAARAVRPAPTAAWPDDPSISAGPALEAPQRPAPVQSHRPATYADPASVPAPWPELASAAPPAPMPPPVDRSYDGNIAGAPYPATEDVLASLEPRPPAVQPAPQARRTPRGMPPPEAPEIDEGQLLENIPRLMRVGIPQTVEVRIARAGTDAGQRPLQGGGTTFHHHVSVTRTMAARLRTPQGGFAIEPLSPETQWIESRAGLMHDGFATWRWAVTPLRRGKGALQLVISARAVDLDGVVAETALPDQIYEIRVRTNYALAARQWGGWLAAMVAGGVLGKFGEGILDLLRRMTGL